MPPTTTDDTRARLGAARYVSLGTWRRDGRVVDTAVWIIGLDDALYCYSADDAGKVKRLRRDAAARVAACDLRGRVNGSWFAASARLIDDAALAARVFSALRRKYGWQMWVADLAARLGRRRHRRAVIEIRLDEDTPAAR